VDLREGALNMHITSPSFFETGNFMDDLNLWVVFKNFSQPTTDLFYLKNAKDSVDRRVCLQYIQHVLGTVENMHM
jgi:hypothetical protein